MESKQNVRYIDLFTSFLKIGLFTFGGGYAMVPLIEQEMVTRRGWVRSDEFIDLLTLAQSVPGPIALNSAAFVGYTSRGYRGALAAVLGIIVPSFVVIMLVAIFFTSIRNNEVVEAAFKAMRPVVIALILSPIVSFLRGMKPLSIAVVVLSMAVIAIFEISPAVVIFAAVVAALLWTRFVAPRVGEKREEARR